MENKSTTAVFESKQIRRHYDDQSEVWYFSVIDIVETLTESRNPRDYWFKMKLRVKTEDGLELSTICRQLKLKAGDGKMRWENCKRCPIGIGAKNR
jgi:DNA-damage-inducible protein D